MGPLYCRERFLFVNFNVIIYNLNVYKFELENNKTTTCSDTQQ